ncbi:Zinc finger RING-type [Arabidopsis suecica]|uniref:Zinc finger RING-type n=1 Tax=Arabidopsis suecica TaxID=45249 RepID=A0A8T2CDR7_ARASU|nr:Zinc finger RING-type [Arabidopsis suecica]
MIIDIYHDIMRNHQPENAGTITIHANINGYDSTFTSSCFLEEFRVEQHNLCHSKVVFNDFLVDSELFNEDDIESAFFELILYVSRVTYPATGNYSPGDDLLVSLLLSHDDDPIEEEDEIEEEVSIEEQDQIDEAVRVSLEETTNISLMRPASKLVVNSLARKTTSSTGERCTICLEEFNDGRRVVTLPCGHEFDDECVLTWFETNHDCPLCRFKLPCGDQ